ncbi:ML5 [Symbiodinium natans]|uniref:ML5 protein n=1 Tax=Symbiodinium natans TaxID=878477 RepID=A0A812K6T8_9DINO|nr:ML5 [Symbiodinium natans]
MKKLLSSRVSQVAKPIDCFGSSVLRERHDFKGLQRCPGCRMSLVQLPFFDGSAFLVNRRTFLDVDVDVQSSDVQASGRACSTPPWTRYVDSCDVEEDAKPVSRILTGSTTVSTEDCNLECGFGRLTTQTSLSASDRLQMEVRDPPASASDNIEESDLEDLQTVMIKNIPCRCSTGEVLRAVDSLGFAGSYDFFYLPMNRRHKQGKGYAFINFIETGTAACFKDAIRGYRFPGRESTKQVEIAAAQLQGRAEMEAYFSRTQIVHRSFRPLM